MKRLFEAIEVPLPQEQVFRYTSNFANIEQWDPGVSRSRKMSPGPVGAGSRFRLLVRTGPSSTPMDYTITRFDPPNRLVLEGAGGSIQAVDDIRFYKIPNGTRIEYTADISLNGIPGLFEPLLHGLLERVGHKAMAGLSRALTDRPPPTQESTVRNILDRLILPGALGFTRFGYAYQKRSWHPMPASLDGKTALVTGATSGLGRVTAEKLAELGARVILVGRDAEKLERSSGEISAATGNDDLSTETADLSLIAEVRSLADRIQKQEKSLHILVNNAAVLPIERSLTDEGLETAFATDLLSPFLLTNRLIPLMRRSAPARIINVLSGGMYLSGINVHDLQNASGNYDGARAYARAKRGLMIVTEHWARKLDGSGVVVNAMHPGWADTPGVRESLPGFHKITRQILRTPEQGADTIVWLAAAAEAGEVSGKFWLDRVPHLKAIIPGTGGSRSQRKKLIEELTRLAA